MRARLGKGLYWLGCTLSVIALIWGGLAFTHPQTDRAIALTAIISILVALTFWVVGRGLRYVLSGK
jgi:hypothetical protein